MGDLFIEKNLPQFLSEKELLDKIREYHNGNKEALNFIIERNIEKVIDRIKLRFSTYYNQQELVSVGMIGLIKSVTTFNEEKNIKFTTYANIVIDNEILMFIRKEKKHLKNESLNMVIACEDEYNRITLEDTLASDEDIAENYEKKEECNKINEILEFLPDKDKEIMKMYYGFYDREYKQEEIAQKFGMSQSYLSKTIKKNLDIIKNEFFKDTDSINQKQLIK